MRTIPPLIRCSRPPRPSSSTGSSTFRFARLNRLSVPVMRASASGLAAPGCAGSIRGNREWLRW